MHASAPATTSAGPTPSAGRWPTGPCPAVGCCSSGSGRRSPSTPPGRPRCATPCRPRRRPPPPRRRRPSSSASSCPAASICSTRVVPVADYGRYADLRPGLKVAAPLELAGTGVGLHPSLGTGPGRRPEGPLRPRARSGFCPASTTPTPTSRTSTRATSGRPGWSPARPRPAGSGAGWTATAARTTRSRGCRCRRELSPVLRGARAPVAAVSSPGDAQAVDPGRLGRVVRPLPAVVRAPGLRAVAAAAGPAAVMAAARQSRRVADALTPYVKDGDTGPTRSRRRVAYPARATAAARWPSACRCSPACSPSRSASASRRWRPTATSTPTTTSPGLARPGPRPPVGAALGAFQADLEARGVADRVLTLVWSRVRPPPAGERVRGHRPRRRRRRLGAGHAGPRRRADRVPRPAVLRPRGQPQGHRRLPARSTPACSRAGSAPAPTRCSRRRRASGASRWSA